MFEFQNKSDTHLAVSLLKRYFTDLHNENESIF